MGDTKELIRTVWVMAERKGVSERTIYRLLKLPEAACFGLVPLDNTGGGAAAVRAGMANSLDALYDLHRAAVSSLRAEAARHRGRERNGDHNDSSLVVACSSGGL